MKYVMDINSIIDSLNLTIFSSGKEKIVENGYTSDLLSVVLAKAPKKSLWITVQRHLNIIAVASIRELTGIIICNNLIPDEEVIKKSNEEGLWLLGTDLDPFTISGKLYKILKDG